MEIFIILGLILLNGIFAMAELSLVSAKRPRLEKSAGEGSAGARVAIELADNPSGFLSTVQVGITLIAIFNGAFGEASLVDQLAPQLAGVLALASYARPAAMALVVAGITFASIVLGELVPKRIAIQRPEAVARLIARPLRALSRLMSPFVRILSFTSDLIMRALRLHDPGDSAPTPEEITGVLKEGTEAGVLEKTEYEIAKRAVRLDDQRLAAIMTPRIDLQFIDPNDALEENLARIAGSPYSRFPVWSADCSHVTGIVHAGDVFEQAVRNKSPSAIDIAQATKPALFVPDTVSAMGLLDQLRSHQAELALVVDEHGQVEGMVTLSDLMSALVGKVPGVAARDPEAVQRDDGSWLVDGSIGLDRLRELLGTSVPFPGEAGGAFHTAAGLLLNQLGHIPKASDHIDWNGYRFEVVDMDHNRIDRLLVSRSDALQ